MPKKIKTKFKLREIAYYFDDNSHCITAVKILEVPKNKYDTSYIGICQDETDKNATFTFPENELLKYNEIEGAIFNYIMDISDSFRESLTKIKRPKNANP